MILAPGWKCPACDGFTGDLKQRHTQCRGCGAERPDERRMRNFIAWMSESGVVHAKELPLIETPALIARAIGEDLIEGTDRGWKLTQRGQEFAKRITGGET